MLPYTIFFGLSCIVSVLAVGLKLKIFVGFVGRMLGRSAPVLDHDQERADLKKKMIATLVIALFEDFPMGAPLARPSGSGGALQRAAKCRQVGVSIIFLRSCVRVV